MDFSDPWIVAVCGGVVAGIVLLFIEYNYFQRKRRAQVHNQGQSRDKDSRRRDQESIPASSWDDAKRNAIASFKVMLDSYDWMWVTPKVVNVSARGETAVLDVEIGPRGDWISSGILEAAVFATYHLTINKTGDILEMKRVDIPIFR